MFGGQGWIHLCCSVAQTFLCVHLLNPESPKFISMECAELLQLEALGICPRKNASLRTPVHGLSNINVTNVLFKLFPTLMFTGQHKETYLYHLQIPKVLQLQIIIYLTSFAIDLIHNTYF